MALLKVTCKTCGCEGFVEPGSNPIACHVCGGNKFATKLVPWSVIYDPHNDKLITTCNKCGKKTYHNAPLAHDCASPIIEKEIWNLKHALELTGDYRPLFCSHCASQNTKTEWYYMSIVNEEYAIGAAAPKFMHSIKQGKSKVQADDTTEAMELSWGVLYSFTPTIWNYGGVPEEDAIKGSGMV